MEFPPKLFMIPHNIPNIFSPKSCGVTGKGSNAHQRHTHKKRSRKIGKMAEPDELYTLRAQFWLGHYQMALDEAKSIMRRPMSPDLKAEREEIVARCYIAMKDFDKVISGDTSCKCIK